MFHSRDSPRLLVCDTGLYLEQNDIGFITVAICGGYISKYPKLFVYAVSIGVITLFSDLCFFNQTNKRTIWISFWDALQIVAKLQNRCGPVALLGVIHMCTHQIN